MKAAFHRDGFVVLRGRIDANEVARGRRLIDESIGANDRLGMLPQFSVSSFCPELRAAPELCRLFDPIAPAIESLLGVEVPVDWVQIALRFPEHRSAAAPPSFHLDGFPAPGNSVPQTSIRRHTLLVGIFLTPVRADTVGGLAVWPGSHQRLAAQLRRLDLGPFTSTPAALLERIEAMDAGDPQTLRVEPGDVVLAHHLLAHSVTSNLSLKTRYALYARLQHPEHDPADARSLVDPAAWFLN